MHNSPAEHDLFPWLCSLLRDLPLTFQPIFSYPLIADFHVHSPDFRPAPLFRICVGNVLQLTSRCLLSTVKTGNLILRSVQVVFQVWVSIPACHVRDRVSIRQLGGVHCSMFFFFFFVTFYHRFVSACDRELWKNALSDGVDLCGSHDNGSGVPVSAAATEWS